MNDRETYFLPGTPLEFPDPETVEGEMVAVGGNLNPETLLTAYSKGIFPWFSQGEPILWWSLDPRFVLFPARIHLSRSLVKSIKRAPFRLSVDTDFPGVLNGCKTTPRPGQDCTWITEGMKTAYIKLHELGLAHSVEAWLGERLAGGLYGVSLGGCFYGESMFALEPEASKTAFAALTGTLIDAGFGMIDCQQHTRHLERFGAVDMPREKFLESLKRELAKPTVTGNWKDAFPDFPDSELWRNL